METLVKTEYEVNRNLQYRSLVSDLLWQRLTERIMKEENVSRNKAEKIMVSALGFLKLCADYPSKSFSPSKNVDIGWHTFIMYTRDYAEFCDKIAGRFIHHEPNDNPNTEMTSGGAIATLAFMQKNNIPFDSDMWVNTLNNRNTKDCDDGKGPQQDCTCT